LIHPGKAAMAAFILFGASTADLFLSAAPVLLVEDWAGFITAKNNPKNS
jgi:hypothetical protein